MSDRDNPGLYQKYHVEKDGNPVEECFVLEPRSDEAARRAIETYISETEDEQLAADLREWIASIYIQEAESR